MWAAREVKEPPTARLSARQACVLVLHALGGVSARGSLQGVYQDAEELGRRLSKRVEPDLRPNEHRSFRSVLRRSGLAKAIREVGSHLADKPAKRKKPGRNGAPARDDLKLAIGDAVRLSSVRVVALLLLAYQLDTHEGLWRGRAALEPRGRARLRHVSERVRALMPRTAKPQK
jgi:hypothetical protein